MSFKGGGQQRFHQHALRAGFDAHAALFAHHFALLIELAENGIVEALRFQQEPQLQPVAREIVEIFRGVLAGSGVQSDAAVFLDELRIGIGDHVAVGLVHGGLELLLQVGDFGLVGVETLVALGVELVVDFFHFIHGRAFLRIVLGADGLGALERHVFEHVRDAGLAAGIVHRAGVHVGMEGHDRRFMALKNDEVQTVGQGKLGDALFEVLQGLRGQRERKYQQEEKLGCGRFHAGFWLSQVSASSIVPASAAHAIGQHGV